MGNLRARLVSGLWRSNEIDRCRESREDCMRIVNVGSSQRRMLFVAYPLLPVSEDSSGGAEQVLSTLERDLTSKGSRVTVAACSGSEVAGTLYVTGAPASGSLGSARMHEARHAAQCM